MGTFGGPNMTEEGLVFAVDAANTKSYPGSGTTWKDLSGNGNDGTLTNGPTFDSGNGGSLVFDGANDYVGFGVLNLETNPSLCVEAWVTKNNSNYEWIVGRYAGANGWHLIYSSNGGFSINGRDGSGLYRTSGYSSTPPNTGYHHIVGNINLNIWEIWVDGILESSTDTGYTDNVFLNSDSLNIAKFNYWQGNIATVKIYNRALSAPEITQNYNALKGRFGL